MTETQLPMLDPGEISDPERARRLETLFGEATMQIDTLTSKVDALQGAVEALTIGLAVVGVAFLVYAIVDVIGDRARGR